MKFRTVIPAKPVDKNVLIDYKSEILLIGSCFTEHIGSRLHYYQFQHVTNPFGILFHPASIEHLVNCIAENEVPNTERYVQRSGRWYSYDAHSTVSGDTSEQLTEELQIRLKAIRSGIGNMTHVVLSYGSAIGFQLRSNNSHVANCHKQPQELFEQRLSTVAILERSIRNTVDVLRALNPELTVLITVSPVRHTRYGIVENSRSKAHLTSAVHAVVDTTERAYYVPAFELLQDDLRDYRFYDKDLVHPSEMAVEYIWDWFMTSWISENVQPVMQSVDRIQKSLLHKPLSPDSPEYLKFVEDLNARKDALLQLYPFMRF